jgi:hypothetical protein
MLARPIDYHGSLVTCLISRATALSESFCPDHSAALGDGAKQRSVSAGERAGRPVKVARAVARASQASTAARGRSAPARLAQTAIAEKRDQLGAAQRGPETGERHGAIAGEESRQDRPVWRIEPVSHALFEVFETTRSSIAKVRIAGL